MALAELSTAEAKLAEAMEYVNSGDYANLGHFENLCHDALAISKEALVSCRRGKDAEGKIKALSTVVKTNLALGDTVTALVAAQDELAMIKRIKGEEKNQVTAGELLVSVYAARSDFGNGLEAATTALAVAKDLGLKEKQASLLSKAAEMHIALSKATKGVPMAQEAVSLYTELGDDTGLQEATTILNVAYAESGKVDKAPGRGAAQSILQDLARAASTSNESAWAVSMEELNKNGAYVQQDLKKIVDAAVEEDSKVTVFFKNVGMETAGASPNQGNGFIIEEIPKPITYMLFRFGGLGYGPRFRYQHGCRGYKQAGDSDPTKKQYYAMATIAIEDCADDWERALEFNPGILDCGLQTGSALGAPRAL